VYIYARENKFGLEKDRGVGERFFINIKKMFNTMLKPVDRY
jgi:hypothetical protein